MFPRHLGQRRLLTVQESALARLLAAVVAECLPRALSHLEKVPGGGQEAEMPAGHPIL